MSDFLEMVRQDYPKMDLDLIGRAYALAETAHADQFRQSGEPYIVHPVEVAKILLSMDMDASAVAAGLLHDVVEDTEYPLDYIRKHFGEEVAGLVDGVTKLSRVEFSSREEQQAESLRKMLLAMAKDIRVVMIRLADRLHNMRTLGYCAREKQLRVSYETLDIHAPLAHRLGIFHVKSELEDLALQYIDPKGYEDLKDQLAMHQDDRQAMVDELIAQIKERLDQAGIKASFEGRPKHLYSIYRKMQMGHTLDQIYDLIAVRVIVETVNDCYAVLGIVHTMWKPIPGRFKDYIAMPKANMYQSLHTTLMGRLGTPFEIQIRTKEMHRTAEYGIAAHWKYKEQRSDSSDMDAKLQWLRQVLEWQTETSDSIDFLNTLKVDLFADQVFVFTPKGMVIELPVGANPIDFAYHIHSAIGNKCVGAKVNGHMVPLNTALRTGDIVEIITSSTTRGPGRDWLTLAKTPQARTKIRAWLKKERREENIEKGRTMLEEAAKRAAIPLPALLRPEWVEPILSRYSLQTLDDLYAAVGYGGITTNQALSRMIEDYRAENKVADSSAEALKMLQEQEHRPLPSGFASQGVIVKGEGNMLVRLAHCCTPVPPDPIVGFITRGRGVSVHRADCPNLRDVNIDPARFIQVEWSDNGDTAYQAELRLEMQDRTGLLVEISNAVASMNIQMVALNARVGKNNVTAMDLTVEIKNKVQLDNLIRQFKKMPEMIRVYRVNA